MTRTRSFDIPSDCTAELSPRGYQFFTDIFESFDQVGPCLTTLTSQAPVLTAGPTVATGPGRRAVAFRAGDPV